MSYFGQFGHLEFISLKNTYLCSSCIQNGHQIQDVRHTYEGETVLFDMMWIFFYLNELLWAIWTFGAFVFKKRSIYVTLIFKMAAKSKMAVLCMNVK